jgi:hypothetical protein
VGTEIFPLAGGFEIGMVRFESIPKLMARKRPPIRACSEMFRNVPKLFRNSDDL